MAGGSVRRRRGPGPLAQGNLPSAFSGGKHAPGMQILPLGRPVGAEFRLGRPAIRPDPVVQRACHPVIPEISTCRDDLGVEGILPVSLDLAQVGGLAMAQERLEVRLLPGAHDLDLEVPAASGPPGVVSRLARYCQTRVYTVDNREVPPLLGGHRERSGDHLPVICHHETIAPQAPWLGGAAAIPGHRAGVSMGGTTGLPGAAVLQVTAGHMDDSVTIEVTIVLPEDTVGQPFSVSQEPGGFMVAFGMIAFGGADSEGHAEGAALGSESGTVGWRRWHRIKIAGLAIPPGWVYLCELIHKWILRRAGRSHCVDMSTAGSNQTVFRRMDSDEDDSSSCRVGPGSGSVWRW